MMHSIAASSKEGNVDLCYSLCNTMNTDEKHGGLASEYNIFFSKKKGGGGAVNLLKQGGFLGLILSSSATGVKTEFKLVFDHITTLKFK